LRGLTKLKSILCNAQISQVVCTPLAFEINLGIWGLESENSERKIKLCVPEQDVLSLNAPALEWEKF